MIGSELAAYPDYLLSRADAELDVEPKLGRFSRRFAPLFVRVFGVPEIGVQLRIFHAISRLPKDARRIVDVGCGAGMLLGAIHRRHPNAAITGIEIDPGSAAIARKAHLYARVFAGDAVTVAAELEGQFDCAVCIDVLEHIPDESLNDFMDAFARLLADGGTLIVHVPATDQRRHLRAFDNWSHHDHEREGFAADTLTGALRRSDFEIVDVRPTFGYLASLAWELNMLMAAKPVQAIGFPILLPLAAMGEKFRSRKGNGLLCVARRLPR
ncbi:MAG: class I SAM-dependent methyltransferase [Vulcanimicrobiaceae bacterium]